MLGFSVDSLRHVRADALDLVSDAPPSSLAADGAPMIAARALEHLASMLHTQSRVEDSPAALDVVARVVLESWITGHAALLLGEAAREALEAREAAWTDYLIGMTPGVAQRPPSLQELARRLDLEMYGRVDPPGAFQRHVASFFDEIDISGADGTVSRFGHPDARRPSAVVADDHVRATLWVVLFLAFDTYTAVGDADAARRARALFDRLRALTAEFYASR